MAYRSSVHESTHRTPYMMMFGRHTLLPGDLICPQSIPETEMTGHDYVQSLNGRLEKVHNFGRSDMAKASDR